MPGASVVTHTSDFTVLDDVRTPRRRARHADRPRSTCSSTTPVRSSTTLERTVDGIELTAQVHVVAPFLLTNLLLPLPASRRTGRGVLTVSSGGMYPQRLDVAALDAPPAPFDGTARVRQRQAGPGRAERAAGPSAPAPRASRSTRCTPAGPTRPACRRRCPASGRCCDRSSARRHRGPTPPCGSPPRPPRSTSSGDFWHDRRRRPTEPLPGTRTPASDADALVDWCVARAGVRPRCRHEDRDRRHRRVGAGRRPPAAPRPRPHASSRPTTASADTSTPSTSELDGEHHAVDTGFIVYNERTYPGFTGAAARARRRDAGDRDELQRDRPGRRPRVRHDQPEHGSSPSAATSSGPEFLRLLSEIGRFARVLRPVLRTEPGGPRARLPAARHGCRPRATSRSRSSCGHAASPTRSCVASWCRSARRSGRPTPTSTAATRSAPTPGSCTTTACSASAASPSGGPSPVAPARYVDALVAPFADRIRLGVAGVQDRRHARARRLAPRRGAHERRSRAVRPRHRRRPTATRRCACSATRRAAEREILSARSATSGTRRRCTPTRRCSPAHRGPAPAWNYAVDGSDGRVTVTYWMNALQRIRVRRTAAGHAERRRRDRPRARCTPRSSTTTRCSTRPRCAAQRRRFEIQGERGVFFAGAYWGYGFHEDGVQSAVEVASTDRGRPVTAVAVYEGTVRHRRATPVERTTSWPVFLAYLDVDALPGALDRVPLWSARRRAPVHFRRRDFLDGADTPLGDAVRDLVAERLGRRPAGRVDLLAHLRTFGWLFNPHRRLLLLDGRRAWARRGGARGDEHALARAPLVRARRPRRTTAATTPKAMHVSPFLRDGPRLPDPLDRARRPRRPHDRGHRRRDHRCSPRRSPPGGSPLDPPPRPRRCWCATRC